MITINLQGFNMLARPVSPEFQQIVALLQNSLLKVKQIPLIEKLIIANPAVIHESDAYGKTLLFRILESFTYKNIQKTQEIRRYFVDLLIKLGADVNALGTNGTTLLHLAVNTYDAYILNRLVVNNTLYRPDDNLQTPLHVVHSYCESVLDILIKAFPAWVDKQDKEGNTALHHALRCRNFKSFYFLLTVGGANDLIANDKGDTVEKLIQEMVSFNVCNVEAYQSALYSGIAARGEVERLEELVKLDSTILKPPGYSENLLHVAAAHNQLAMVSYLIARQPAFLTSDYFKNPLSSALENGCLEAADLIRQAKPELLFNQIGTRHLPLALSPFICAVRSGQLTVVEWMMNTVRKVGSEVLLAKTLAAKDYDGGNALFYAVQHDHPHILKLLCENCTYSFDDKDTFDRTVLGNAMKHGSLAVITYLLDEQHVKVNLSDFLLIEAHRLDVCAYVITKVDLLNPHFAKHIQDNSDLYEANICQSRSILIAEIERRLEGMVTYAATINMAAITPLADLYTSLFPSSAIPFLGHYFLRIGAVEKSYEMYQAWLSTEKDPHMLQHIHLSIAEMFLASKILHADLPMPTDEIELRAYAAIGAFPHVFAVTSPIATRMQNMAIYGLFGRSADPGLLNLAEPINIAEQTEPLPLYIIALLQTHLEPLEHPTLAPVVAQIIEHNLQLQADRVFHQAAESSPHATQTSSSCRLI